MAKAAPPLSDLAVLAALPARVRDGIASAPRRRFRRGETLWVAGAEARGLIIVLSGRVQVVRATDGRQYTIHTEGPGGTLGDVPFFAGGCYPATAIALEPTTGIVLDRSAFARAVAADPEFAFWWLGRLAGRRPRPGCSARRTNGEYGRAADGRAHFGTPRGG